MRLSYLIPVTVEKPIRSILTGPHGLVHLS